MLNKIDTLSGIFYTVLVVPVVFAIRMPAGSWQSSCVEQFY